MTDNVTELRPKKDKLRLLWYSDSPCCASGFGTVARNLLDQAVASDRYDITVLGINHWVPWYSQERYPYPIWAAGMNPERHPYGFALLARMLAAGDYDLFFSLQDLGVLASYVPAVKAAREAIAARKGKQFRWVHYFPLDVDWVFQPHVEALREVDQAVTYTTFARDALHKVDPKLDLAVVPHGCDPQTFYPLTAEERQAARQEYFGIDPDRFMVMCVARNQWRKDLVRTMRCFREFKEQYSQERRAREAVLYLHSKVRDVGGNLMIQARQAGLDMKQDVIFTPDDFNENQGYNLEDMNRMYNAADAVVSTALGEGWGLAMTEAFCTKTPALMPENTSHIEIIGREHERGYLCRSGGGNNWMVAYGQDDVMRPTVDPGHFASQLARIMRGHMVAEKVERAYEWAQEHTWENVWACNWSAILEV